MSEEKFEKVSEIAEAEIQAASIEHLRTAPNRGGTYGANGLQPEALKKKFDELPLLVKDKLHKLIAAYNALVESITSGVLGDALMVSGVDSLTTLPQAIDKVASDLLGERNDNTITTLAMLSAAIQDDKNFATKVFDAIAAKSAVKVNGKHVAEFDADTFADGVIASIVDGAPEALNTIREIAAALENNPDFATAIIENAKKAAAEAAAEVAAEVAKQAVDGKLDKVNDRYRLYATDGNGEQITHGYSTSLVKSSFPMRKINGEIETGRAKAPNDAVPLSQMNEALAEKDLEIDILRKRVVNLEQGITPDPYLTDDSTSYVKTVPADALPYARLEAVGGMVHKEDGIRNLFKMDTIVSDYNDGSYYELKNADAERGSVTVRGSYTPQLTLAEMFPDIVEGKTYTLSLVCSYAESEEWEVWIGNVYINKASAPKSASFTATSSVLASCISFNSGTVYEEFEMFPGEMEITHLMIVEGETVPDEFIPYGVTVGGEIRETKVTAIESVGKNLFDESAVTGGISLSTANYTDKVKNTGEYLQVMIGVSAAFCAFAPNKLYFTKGQTVRVSADIWCHANGGTYVAILLRTEAKVTASVATNLTSLETWERKSLDINITADGWYYLAIQGGATGLQEDFRVKNITVTTDTTVTEYIPYRKTTLPIPAEVKDLPGYGWGIPNGAHNGIEFDEDGKATFVKRVERKVFDGTEAWYLYDIVTNRPTGTYCYYSKTNGTVGSSRSLCSHSTWKQSAWSVGGDGTHDNSRSSESAYFVTTTPTAGEWKAQVAKWYVEGDPLVLYYELAEPIVTDISHLITRDNFIEVEGGGIIIAQNENADAAPTAIKYQLKEG